MLLKQDKMKMNIIKETKNPLFARRELQLTVDAEIVPNHKDIKKSIAEKFSVEENTIKIKNILGKFGSKTFTISANIYPSKEEKNKVELKKKREIEEEKAQNPEKVEEKTE